jgi:hypothetical protein
MATSPTRKPLVVLVDPDQKKEKDDDDGGDGK